MAGGVAEQLVGSWRLVAMRAIGADGSVLEPYGPDPEGVITYTADGRMHVNMQRRGRPAGSVDFLTAPAEEIREAFLGYAGYTGSFDVDEDEGVVRHHVDVAWVPGWSGATQIRFYELDGDRLTLRGAPRPQGGTERRSELVWQRM